MAYKQLDLAQRYKIECYLRLGKSQSEIAKLIGVHRSTISRELNRNVGKRGLHCGVYRGAAAHQKAWQRHHCKYKRTKLTWALKYQIKHWMEHERLSPELISVELRLAGLEGLSHERIYQWIWACKKSNKQEDRPFKSLYNYLRHGRRRRKRGNYKDNRGSIKDRISIEQRPKVVDLRNRIGDIEVDLMMGKKHGPPLLVMTDRATLITTLDKLEDKNAEQIARLINQKIARMGTSWIKTMTFDNGKEFAQHMKITQEHGVKTYFTRPYTSQDKGTVENRIGLIRRWLPKGCDLSKVSQERIKEIEKLINNRKVRKFGYISPIEKLKSTWPVALIT